MRAPMTATLHLDRAADEYRNDAHMRINQQASYIADYTEQGDGLDLVIDGRTIHCKIESVTKP